jgi:hypothetical protein
MTSLPPAMALLPVISCDIRFGTPTFLAVPLPLVFLMAVKILYVAPRAEPLHSD